jgi:hypothetical protein
LSPVPLLLVAMFALVGTLLLVASNALVTPTTVNIKRGLHGAMDSNSPPVTDMNPPVQNFVVNAYWNQIQPNGPNDFDTSSIDAQLAKASATSARVRLRVFAGRFSPDWVKNQVGSIPWTETFDVQVGTYRLPLFWTPEFSARYNNFMNKLAAKYDNDNRVAEVTISKCMTTYAEPMIRQQADATNVKNALSAGYTYTADTQCLKQNIDNVSANWSRTRFSIALNPFQGFNRPASDTPLTVTLDTMQYCRKVLGWRCVIGNNSLRSTSLGQDYEDLYAAMKAAGPPMYFQTATPQRIGDYQATLDKAVALGAWSVELNAGYATYSKTLLKTIDQQLQQN